MIEPAFLRGSIVAFAEEIARTPIDAPSVRLSKRTKREVLMDAIGAAADLLQLQRGQGSEAGRPDRSGRAPGTGRDERQGSDESTSGPAEVYVDGPYRGEHDATD